MTQVPVPICAGCAHLRGSLRDPRCDAFPDGIPRPILLSEADHRQPFRGDGGVLYEPRTDSDREHARVLFGVRSR